jgi:hypothetical protein
VAAPAEPQRPGGHATQALAFVAPARGFANPAAQGVQADAPTAAHLPRGHVAHLFGATGVVPAGQVAAVKGQAPVAPTAL